MAELDDMIRNLISSPEGINKIMSVIGGLLANQREGDPSAQSTAGSDPGPASEAGVSSNESGTFGGEVSQARQQAVQSPAEVTAISSVPDLTALSKIDPRYVSAVMGVLREYSSDDERIHLLNALKPHLKDERRQRIDRAAQILRITKSIRAVLKGLPGGDKHHV
jgi:hypothetical protein